MSNSSKHLLFIDIETATVAGDFKELSPQMQRLWKKKAKRQGFAKEEEQENAFFDRGGIFAEFGQVITVALGHMDGHTLHVQGLVADDEKALLELFSDVLSTFPKEVRLCGHNIKEFDIPYLCRRMVVQRISPRPPLYVRGKRPWEVGHIDTMELWKFGDYKAYTSLDLLANVLGLGSSKEDMDGSQVNGFFHKEKDIERIKHYCMRDVVVTAQLYRRMQGLPLLTEEAVVVKA